MRTDKGADQSSRFLVFDGELIDQDKFGAPATNRSFRYGDGFFTTARWAAGIVLGDYHWERIVGSFRTLDLLMPNGLTLERLEELAASLCRKNSFGEAILRINFYRGGSTEDGLKGSSGPAHFVMESRPLRSSDHALNERGLRTNFFTSARKCADAISGVKHNNFLPYVLAARWSAGNDLDDALLLNQHERLADATSSNIFIVSKDIVRTPSLAEGCVSGTMRRYVISYFAEQRLVVLEEPLTREALLSADEVFLTNAVSGIRWVAAVGGRRYENQFASQLYQEVIRPLFGRKP